MSSSAYVTLGIVFAAGAVLFAVGSAIVAWARERVPVRYDSQEEIAPSSEAVAARLAELEPVSQPELEPVPVPEPEPIPEPQAPPVPVPSTFEHATWTHALGIGDDAELDVEARLEMIERLWLIGAPWCIEALHAAKRDERDPVLLDAIDAALRAR